MRDMMNEVVFADTYAILAIIQGASTYKRFLKHQLVCCEGNIIELYYHLLRKAGKRSADSYAEAYASCTVQTTFSTIQKAMLFKYRHRREKLSYVDCVGYAAAQELGIPFLTGDNKFEGKDNVLFVQAENS